MAEFMQQLTEAREALKLAESIYADSKLPVDHGKVIDAWANLCKVMTAKDTADEDARAIAKEHAL